jgi:hypothetical protein
VKYGRHRAQRPVLPNSLDLAAAVCVLISPYCAFWLCVALPPRLTPYREAGHDAASAARRKLRRPADANRSDKDPG